MKKKIELRSTELKVLRYLSEKPQSLSQREIARRTGLSIGLINAILKKLIRTGYVKTAGLNRRTVQYLLTPRGFAEKALKTYDYVLRTINSYYSMRSCLDEMVRELHTMGATTYYLHGEGELAMLISDFFRSLSGEGETYQLIRGLPKQTSKQGIVFNATPFPLEGCPLQVMDMVTLLERSGVTPDRLDREGLSS